MGFFNERGTGNNRNMTPNPMVITPMLQADQNCQNAKKEVADAFLALGHAYYEANKDNSASEFAEQLLDIKDKIEKETLWNQFRLSLEGKTKCEHCGMIITSDSAFCNKCGGKIAPRDFSAIVVTQNQQDTTPSQNVCPTCGSPLIAGAAFCEKCGTRVM